METLWEPIVDAVSMFRNVKIPVLQIYVFELTNTLLGAQLLRQQVDYKMHWLRALILTFIGGIGGNSAAAIFTGNTPRWFNGKSELAFRELVAKICGVYTALYIITSSLLSDSRNRLPLSHTTAEILQIRRLSGQSWPPIGWCFTAPETSSTATTLGQR
jgi:hypothetical protein